MRTASTRARSATRCSAAASINTAPGGTLDGVTNSLSGIQVMGWAMSPLTAAPINVDFYVNGVMVKRVLAAGSRHDVAAMFPANGSGHGYDVALPATHGTICAYAIDPALGSNPSIGCRAIPAAAPTGSLDGATRSAAGIRFRGWAAAPGTTGPINVDLYLNGTMLGRVLAVVEPPRRRRRVPALRQQARLRRDDPGREWWYRVRLRDRSDREDREPAPRPGVLAGLSRRLRLVMR